MYKHEAHRQITKGGKTSDVLSPVIRRKLTQKAASNTAGLARVQSTRRSCNTLKIMQLCSQTESVVKMMLEASQMISDGYEIELYFPVAHKIPTES